MTSNTGTALKALKLLHYYYTNCSFLLTWKLYWRFPWFLGWIGTKLPDLTINAFRTCSVVFIMGILKPKNIFRSSILLHAKTVLGNNTFYYLRRQCVRLHSSLTHRLEQRSTNLLAPVFYLRHSLQIYIISLSETESQNGISWLKKICELCLAEVNDYSGTICSCKAISSLNRTKIICHSNYNAPIHTSEGENYIKAVTDARFTHALRKMHVYMGQTIYYNLQWTHEGYLT
jgi:hypothetical protein